MHWAVNVTDSSPFAQARGQPSCGTGAANCQRPPLPARVGDLFEREERCTALPGDYAAVAEYVAAHATPKG